MNPDESRQTNFQLVSLGKLDGQRAEIQKLIDSVPRVLAARQRDSREAEEQVEAAKDKLRGFQAHLKTLELDLASREEALQKANANLMTAKSNEQYTLLIAEVARRKEDKGAVETSVLEQYEVIKMGERMVADAKQRLETARAEYGDFEARALTELQEHQKQAAALDERREAVRKAIVPETLKVYDRAYKAHGNAIVPAEGKTCQGCFSSLTPNENNTLLSGRQIVLCRVCQRILYMPDALQAPSP